MGHLRETLPPPCEIPRAIPGLHFSIVDRLADQEWKVREGAEKVTCRAWSVWSAFLTFLSRTIAEMVPVEGPIVRIAPNELAISDPDAIKTIYAVNSGFTKVSYRRVFPRVKP